MAIQTQGFQFQNLARYTPVDPTLVGVDFSRIGSGIADAMKLGSSLQQYQMRKQAMEEEQATRESRIAQANAAAKYLAAQANARLALDIPSKLATAEAAEFESKVPVAQLTGATAKGRLGLLPSTLEAERLGTQLNIGQITQNLSLLPKEGLLKSAKLDLEQNITDFKKQNADLINTLGLTEDQLKVSYLQQNIQRAEAAGLQDLASAYKALMPAPSKVPNYVGMINALERQIQEQEKRVVVDAEGNKTNLETYIATVGEPGTQKTSGLIFKTPVKRDERLDKEWTNLQRIKSQRDSLINAQLGAFQFGTGGGAGGGGGGGGGGGMAVNVPTLGGQAQSGTPYLDNLSATIQKAIVERLGGGIAQAAQGAQIAQSPAISPPVLDDLINASVTTPTEGVVRTPAAAPAAAQGPAATMEIKDGKIVPVKSVMERAEGATQKAIEFAKDKPASAILAAAAAKKVIPPAVKLSGSALKTLLSYTPEAIAGARTLASRATPVLAANEILGSFIRTDEKPSEETGLEIADFKTKFGAGSAVPRIARLVAQSIYEPEGSRQIQDEIEGISEEIKSISQSNLTATEKLSQIRPLREQLGELVQKANANAIKSKPRAKMINIPRDQVPIINIDESIGVPIVRPEAKMINIPREQVPVITIDESKGIPVQRPAAKMINIPEELAVEDLLSRIFYGKTLEERINSKFYSGR